MNSDENPCRASVHDIAKEWSVSTRHISNMAKEGRIPGMLVGNTWRFDPVAVREALTTFTANRRSRPKPAAK